MGSELSVGAGSLTSTAEYDEGNSEVVGAVDSIDIVSCGDKLENNFEIRVCGFVRVKASFQKWCTPFQLRRYATSTVKQWEKLRS